MILIISEHFDQSTNFVIDYLRKEKTNFVRISGETRVVAKSIEINNNYIEFNLLLDDQFYHNFEITFSQISVVWYRRGKINLKFNHIHENDLDSVIKESLNKYLIKDISTLEYLINYLLKFNKPNINSYLDNNITKLEVLLKANEVGLNIPNTLITPLKGVLLNKLKEIKCITKDINNGHILFGSEFHTASGNVIMIENEMVDNLAETTFPNLIQECIDKEYEIRTFFLCGKFYSTAIFSQNDEMTKVDFRNYNFEKLNRVVPYKLPLKIEAKLKKLMSILHLNSGSIDIIKTKDNKFIFLEVNPVGQYNQVSVPGQYFLNKLIAKNLIKMHNEQITARTK